MGILLVGCALIGVGNVLIAVDRGEPWQVGFNTILIIALGGIWLEHRDRR